MKFWQIALVAAAFGLTASAAERQTYRDSSGRTTGTVTTSGSRATYRDAQGRTTMTSTTNGSTTTFRDAQGRVIGTQTVSGSRATYRDAQGRTVATSTRARGTARASPWRTCGRTTSSSSSPTPATCGPARGCRLFRSP